MDINVDTKKNTLTLEFPAWNSPRWSPSLRPSRRQPPGRGYRDEYP